MYDVENGVPFDPGYASSLIAFLPMLEQVEFELGQLRNFNQKKMKFKMLLPLVKKSLFSTLGFWVGCILWAGVIKYKLAGAPILGNNFLKLSKEDLEGFEYAQEFEAIENYIKNYSKNVQYYLGLNETLPDGYLQIVADYKEFLQSNEHFINAKTTNDLKIPKSYEHLAQADLDALLAMIEDVIASKDLSRFLSQIKINN